MNVFSQSSKTSCFTWLAMLVMLLAFIMVVFLIRIT
ncbi:Short transient receptor potential channel 6 [Bienertia sinuspersici]